MIKAHCRSKRPLLCHLIALFHRLPYQLLLLLKTATSLLVFHRLPKNS
uniref:Unplaced genomic scaffold supercont1.9, whole genome shotgun sequence n=1 Tax=Cryptococcus bacillisporus CA1280 TaxID=1296109 RepID=A0A0D0VIA3_CRYGA|nr:hypothetical protein I312_03450 [Cryptococcus bacillisporus CA1280]